MKEGPDLGGLSIHTPKGQIKPGGGNNPIMYAGFAVRGPVILLGSPDDVTR